MARDLTSRHRLSVAAAAAFVTTLLLVTSSLGAVASPPAGTINTFAGGVGGPAHGTAVAIHPMAIASGGSSLYVADQAGQALRVISASTGALTNLAGVGVGRSPADGAEASAASLAGPMGSAIDSHGNVLIAEGGDASACGGCGDVLLVAAKTTGTFYGRSMTAGHVYAIAGTIDQFGDTGDGGPARNALLDEPGGVAVDAAGDVAIIDYANDSIRFIPAKNATYFGTPGPAFVKGDIYTLAGNGVRSYSGNGYYAFDALINVDSDSAITFDASGNLLFADSENDVVRLIAASSKPFYGQSMTAGYIYSIAGNGIYGHSGDGGLATSAELAGPIGVTLDANGSVVIADTGNNLVRVLAKKTATAYGRSMTANHLYTIAGKYAITGSFSGDGGAATAAHLYYPNGVAVDAKGNVAISDALNNRVRLVAEKTAAAYGQAMHAGRIYTVAGNGSTSFSGDGGPALDAQMHDLTGAVVDGSGNLIVADGWNERLRIIPTKNGTYYGRALQAGRIYTLAGTGTEGFSGDKGPAAKASIGLVNHYNGVGDYVVYATGMALDHAGNLVFADTDNHRIRVIAAQTGTFYGQSMHVGDIYTLAGTGTFGYSGDGGLAKQAKMAEPDGIALDASGNIVFTDVDGIADALRVVAEKTGTFYGQSMTVGHIYSLIGKHCSGGALGDGGLASHACLAWPTSVAIDAKGNLLVGDYQNGAVRLVAAKTGTDYGHSLTALHIISLASGVTGSMTLDAHGNVLVASSKVQVIAARSATYYGKAMTLGHVYAIAGNGSTGVSGDGGPALHAELSAWAIAVNNHGDLFIADPYSNRIRMVEHY